MRFEAAKKLKMASVPVIVMNGLTEAQKRAIAIQRQAAPGANGTFRYYLHSGPTYPYPDWGVELRRSGCCRAKLSRMILMPRPKPNKSSNPSPNRVTYGFWEASDHVRELDKKRGCGTTDWVNRTQDCC